MSKSLFIHSTINIALMIILFILNFTNIGGSIALIVLAIVFVCNTILLLRANSKQVKKDGTTMDNYEK
ncbi:MULTISPECIES: hypothetical protein [Staphylococcus]|uniref:hypothetical protein n=1 Tax=Staphylococcus TaxID=1279 RepID=UPI000267D88E|nr:MULTISPECIES: hypothetical protein [Staphylococcus]EJX19102.1 hypothetical protein SOJ_00410 [Staphylococcus sp. OJ82]MDK9844628.1 hypothetical protein [Staphylococcus equorum]MDK9858335.1 hypothetical protein [Staphylococcus equorum]MDK9860902.1 hypothetical protein [Staphylococcus equorum]MDK9875438.1 hypothetical protein [Staphylococcus equorum]